VQGDCQTDFEQDKTLQGIAFDPPLLARKSRQCAIVGSTVFFEINRNGGNITFSNLYLRMQRTDVESLGNFQRMMNFNGVKAWLSGMTFHGDKGVTQALFPFQDAQVYVQGAASLPNGHYHTSVKLCLAYRSRLCMLLCADSIIEAMNYTTGGPIAELRKKSSLVLDNCVLRGNTNLDPEDDVGGAAISINDVLASSPCAVMVRTAYHTSQHSHSSIGLFCHDS
jgi:hypothetical protein